ncbi:urease accessory protein UreD [Halorientalis sp. IM1011]|uniref:urease accessory protein UreD n=1 Tax=Halorientalis sp. IM1011 TaxID=1932360 RepID=UPI00097CD6C2|nr:urease accessory protein UreD [Halorientalis sp. IM1011]AQL43754.1 urease accessory protein UreD [Halorientalis sp. IM1011]
MAARNPREAFAAYADERLPPAADGAVGKEGRLEAAFAAVDGETRLVQDYATVPFHLTGALDHDEELPGLATVYLQSPTGAVAQGDRHDLSVTVGADARAHVSTGNATKVHGMDRNFGRVDVDLSVAEDGYLEYLPEPTILHADARFRGETILSVAEGASAVVGEVLVPGRLARDEVFEFERAYTRLQARDADGLLFEDTTDLHPAERDPRRPGVMGVNDVLGTLYVVGDAAADPLHERVADATDARAGATALPNDAGVMVRALGERAAVSGALDAAWDEARRLLVGAPAPERRKD